MNTDKRQRPPLASSASTGVLLVGIFLAVIGFVTALVTINFADEQFHGLTYANTWPAIALAAAGCLTGIALCMRWRPANLWLVTWALAFSTWLLLLTWTANDGSWVLGIILSSTTLVATGYVLGATRK